MQHSQINPQGLNTTFQSQGLLNETRQQKFSIRKELYRGIKDNDVEKIVSRTTDREDEEDFKYDEYTDIHNVLTEKRKNYDEHKTSTNIRKKQIQALKKQIQELVGVESSLKQTIDFSKEELKSAEQSLENTQKQTEYTIFRKDVYQNISERSNTIFLVEKKRLFNLQLDLQKVKSQHRSCLMEAANKKKLEQQCRKMLVSIEKVVQVQKRGREHRLSSMHNVLEKKNDAVRKRSQRQRQISFLVQQAANQKSAQQKEWDKLFFANRFLHVILKNKISRELATHQVVQKTFQRIKLNTGVSQADQLVQKYLTRQQTYGQLLNSISEKQPLLQKQQALNQKLKTQLRQLSEQQTQEVNIAKKIAPQNIQIKEKERQVKRLSQKTIAYQRQKQAFYQWAIKFVKKHDSITGKSTKDRLNLYQIYPRNQKQIIYQKVQSIIKELLDQADKNPQHVSNKLLQNKSNSTLESDMIIRNMRIKTQGNQFQYQDENQGQQYNELQYLADHRRSIKRDEKNKRFRIKTRAH